MKHRHSTDTTGEGRLAFAGPELAVITNALQEYAAACALGAEMVAGRDEERRLGYLQEEGSVQRLLARIGSAA